MTAAEILWDDDPFPDTIHRALTAAGIPMEPPASWFARPTFIRPTPVTVSDDGHVYGHIAPFKGVPHIGHPGQNTRPPKSRADYGYFKTGYIRTAEGKDVPVGQITLAGGHANLTADQSRAVAHYDDTRSAIADVNAGEDRYGVWISGALRPDASPLAVRALRASAPSGDWRVINGALELIAVLQVNSPGFPIPRCGQLVASGAPVSLVAAGAWDMYALKMAELVLPEHLTAAIDARIELAGAKAALRARVAGAYLAG